MNAAEQSKTEPGPLESGAALVARVCARLDGVETTLLHIFQRHDTDDSGSLDATELRKSLKELGIKVTKDEARKIVTQIDVDGDGLLNISEFLKRMLLERQKRLGLPPGAGGEVDSERALAQRLSERRPARSARPSERRVARLPARSARPSDKEWTE